MARPLPIEVSCSEDWTRLNKVKTIQEIGGSLKRLEKVMEEVEQELYHKKLLMKLRYHRYRTDESAACKVTMFDNPFWLVLEWAFSRADAFLFWNF